MHTAFLLLSGHGAGRRRIGRRGAGFVGIYDPATSQCSAGPNLVNARARFTATLLPNLKVLAVGGQTATGLTATAELFE